MVLLMIDKNSSPGRLAESSPHTMHEDRAILESVFAKNRNAIVDVHMLDTPRHKHGFSSSSDRLANAGAHHRKLSTSTGVECPPLPDVRNLLSDSTPYTHQIPGVAASICFSRFHQAYSREQRIPGSTFQQTRSTSGGSFFNPRYECS